MTAFNLHFLLWIVLQASMFWNISPYRTFYAEEECRKGGVATIHLGNDTDNSSGIFRASKDGRQLPEMHCHIILKPPPYGEIVTSVRGIELMPPVNCHSYVELNSSSDIRIRLCGHFYDKMEMESYSTLGDTDVIFHTEHANASTPNKTKMQFEIIFTAVQSRWTAKDTTTKKCNDDEVRCLNGRCVWKGLVNDGHNNCGDLSDEFLSDDSQSNHLSAGMTLVVVVPIIILSLALIVLMVCCFGHRLTAKIERLVQTEQLRSEAARNAFINSSSPSPRQNYNTITVDSNVTSQNTDLLAPRLDVEVSGHLYQQWRSRVIGEQRAFRVSPNHTATDIENDLQLPCYDPPPSYESVTVSMKEKH